MREDWGATATGLGFVCFFFVIPCVLSATELISGIFC